MKPRRTHHWILWLLPLFLLRAFVPVGFMLSWSEDGMRIVMCSGSGPLPTSQDASAGLTEQHQHASHTGGQHEHSQAHDSAMCPFAAAGISAAPQSFDAVVAFVATVSHEVLALPAADLPGAAVPTDRIRGPPLA